MTIQQAYNNIRDHFELEDKAELEQIKHLPHKSVRWIKCDNVRCYTDHCKVIKECDMLYDNEEFSYEMIPELEFQYKASR